MNNINNQVDENEIGFNKNNRSNKSIVKKHYVV